jgi:membrane-bound ClpP family serine protease
MGQARQGPPAVIPGKETFMPLRTLLLIAGLIALVFGLGFLLVPRPVLALYGVPADPGIVLMSRFFGAALVQLGLVLYLIRDVTDPRTQRGVVLGSFVGSLAGLVVALTGQFWGLVNQFGWSTVAIYGLLLLGYGSFVFGRPQSS